MSLRLAGFRPWSSRWPNFWLLGALLEGGGEQDVLTAASEPLISFLECGLASWVQSWTSMAIPESHSMFTFLLDTLLFSLQRKKGAAHTRQVLGGNRQAVGVSFLRCQKCCYKL